MLKGKQLEGLKGLLDILQGTAESTNKTERARMKRFLPVAMENGLTDHQREIIKLIYVDGLTQRQAGERLGIKQPAVSNIKRRAIDRLRDLSRYTDI